MGVLDDAIREHLALRRRHGAAESELERQENEALGPARREPSPRNAAEPAASPPAVDAVAGERPEAGALADDRPPAGERLVEEVPRDDLFEEYGAEPPGPASEEVTRISAPGALDDERILDEEELAEEELADELAGREGGLADAEGLTTPSRPDAAVPESPTEEHATVFTAPPAGPGERAADGDELAEEPLEGEELLAEEAEPVLADERALDEEAALEEEEVLLEEGEPVEADESLREGLPADAADADEDEDVLEDTPDFLQETPEHERLWFEQKPPRDFDLDR